MKECGRCKKSIPLKEFSKDTKAKDGLQQWCRGCFREYRARWERENLEHRTEYRLENKDKRREQIRQWQRKNPIRLKLSKRKADRLRDERMRGAGTPPSKEALESRMSMFDNKCIYCGGPWEEIEHTRPVSRGGTNHLANLRPICAKDNMKKGAKTHKQYLAYLELEASLRSKT